MLGINVLNLLDTKTVRFFFLFIKGINVLNLLGTKTVRFFFYLKKTKLAQVAQLDVHQTGDQEDVGSTPAGLATYFQ